MATAIPSGLGLGLLALAAVPSLDGDLPSGLALEPLPRRAPPLAPTFTPPPDLSTAPSLALARIRLPPPPSPGGDRPLLPDRFAEPLAAATAPEASSISDASQSVDRLTGAVMLARIEAGTGPALELHWPRGSIERQRIAGHLTRCAGLAVAVMARGRLWRLEDPSGRAWMPDPARLSTLARRAEGVAPSSVDRIRRHHGVAKGVPIAFVARGFDIRLLDGLARLMPSGERIGRVEAGYGVRDGWLVLSAIAVDGRPIAGEVRLARIGRCG